MYTTEGIILKKQDSGEADAFFTVYTKEYGKIRAVAQGVKKNEAKLKGHLEPLNLSLVSFVLGKNGERLVQASLIKPWHAIRGDYIKLKAALHIATAIDERCFPGERDERLWDLLLGTFALLEKNGIDAQFIPLFEQRLEERLGYSAQTFV